jgi:hypothetical protein
MSSESEDDDTSTQCKVIDLFRGSNEGKNSQERIRVVLTIDFSPRAYRQFQEVKELEAEVFKEVSPEKQPDTTRNAYRLYHWYLKKKQLGHPVVAIDPENDVMHEVKLE